MDSQPNVGEAALIGSALRALEIKPLNEVSAAIRALRARIK